MKMKINPSPLPSSTIAEKKITNDIDVTNKQNNIVKSFKIHRKNTHQTNSESGLRINFQCTGWVKIWFCLILMITIFHSRFATHSCRVDRFSVHRPSNVRCASGHYFIGLSKCQNDVNDWVDDFKQNNQCLASSQPAGTLKIAQEKRKHEKCCRHKIESISASK